MMISVKTVNNLTKVEWKRFFKTNDIKNYSRFVNSATFQPLTTFLNETDQANPGDFRDSVDELIYKKICYEKSNLHTLFSMKYSQEKLEVLRNEIVNPQSNNFRNFNFNRSFFDDDKSGSIRILTSRFYLNNQEDIDSINIVIKAGDTDEDDPKYFFTIVTLDFTNNLFSLNFSKGVAKHFPDRSLAVKHQVLDFLERNIFPLLEIHRLSMNINKLKRVLFSMYISLSDKIEDQIKERLPEDTTEEIINFLEGLDIEVTESYINQIIAVIFQDIGKELNSEIYSDGWVFRFAFQEGDYTRATTRTDNYEPIYISPVFWNLKELINSKRELISVGFLWKVKIDEEDHNIYFKIEVQNENLVVHYYQLGEYKIDRRVKESYVRRKVRQYLSDDQ